MTRIREECSQNDADYLEIERRGGGGFSVCTVEKDDRCEVVISRKQAIKIAEFFKNDTES